MNDPGELIPDKPAISFEQALWVGGLHFIAGIDEAGRGALAGPVVAGAVILPWDADVVHDLHGVRDSKQMTAAQRTLWAHSIRQVALAWGVGYATAAEIDAIGILPATRLAASRAIEALGQPVQYLLLDYLLLPEFPGGQTSLVKGDRRSLSIAAASVLAKTDRDQMMVALDEQYPAYCFRQHKGYGTAYHLAALKRMGPSPVHRCTFRPVHESFGG